MEKPSFDQSGNRSEQPSRMEHISEAEQEAFDLLSEKHKELAIKLDPEKFSDEYRPEDIELDKEAVERKRSKMVGLESVIYKRAQLLEAILAEQIDLSDWFGSDVMTIIPSEYDDFFNAIDLVAEFEKEETFQYMAAGIDVTSSAHPVKKKLDTIKSHIQDGSLTKMKYFQSERNTTQKKLENVFKFVIGVDPRTIHELASLWLTVHKARIIDDSLNKDEIEDLRQKAKEAQVKLAKHRAQVLILKQLQAQLRKFGEFAKKKNLPDIETKFVHLLVIIDDILATKKISVKEERDNDDDDVYRALMKELDIFLSD